MMQGDPVPFALAQGFSEAVPFEAALLHPQERIRALCRPESCQNYGRSWYCPPCCGALDAMERELRSYPHALLLTTRHRVDWHDAEALRQLSEAHIASVDRVADRLPDSLRLSVGGCRRCEVCACPDAPCRFPLPRRGAVSAYGIDVAELCGRLGVPFAFEEGIVVYVSIVLWND